MSFKRTLTVTAVVVAAVVTVAFAGVAKAGVPAIASKVVAKPDVTRIIYKPDLVITSSTSTSVTIQNRGFLRAGPFSVVVSQGFVGDTCGWAVPPLTRIYGGLLGGATLTISLKDAQSSIDRIVAVDYLNQVDEASELNNLGIVPGATIIC